MEMALVCLCAIVLDRFLEEPPRWHPLVGFGWLSQRMETLCYGSSQLHPDARLARGGLALFVLVAPLVLVAWGLSSIPYLGFLIDIGLLYLALGATSLARHASAVAEALQAGELEEARSRVGRIVSRDTETMSEEEVSLATVESVLENGCDAVFGALFWFFVAGAPPCGVTLPPVIFISVGWRRGWTIY